MLVHLNAIYNSSNKSGSEKGRYQSVWNTCGVSRETLQTFIRWWSVRDIWPIKSRQNTFWIKMYVYRLQDVFLHSWKAAFYRVRQWQQWCVGVPSGALTLQTGCQFLHTLLFWSTLKLGHFFLFNSDFKNSSYDTNWWKHQRNRWLFLWITYTRCSRPDGYGEKRNPEERSD